MQMPSFETWLAGASVQAPIDAVLRIHELHAAEAVHGNRQQRAGLRTAFLAGWWMRHG
ncbi:MAG: hypothetical protein HY898_36285 [Deltaproteobacteria bacterium]|nr:hypothetical protein [Deltaproteobacteria bacterium]